MEIKVNELKEVDTLVDIICDSCGISCYNNLFSRYEFMKMESYWGFGSKKDTEKWLGHICELCVDTKLTFIKFKKETYINL